MGDNNEVIAAQLEKCRPKLESIQACESLDFRYRLLFQPRLPKKMSVQDIKVEVVLFFRFERCPGPLALGDLAYTITLLPGEQVRLFTSDRHTRFVYDSESKMSYRFQTTSEESYYMAGMAQAMSNLSVLDQRYSSSQYSESSFGGGTSGGFSLFGLFEWGGSVSGSSFDSQSTCALLRSLVQHAESSSRHVEVGARAACSVSIGEVCNRTHTQTESQDHYEAATRLFSNANKCHALTYFFYRINKSQRIRFSLARIERHIIDPIARTNVAMATPGVNAGVSIIPSGLLATAKDRIETEERARQSAMKEAGQEGDAAKLAQVSRYESAFVRTMGVTLSQTPLPISTRQAAIDAVDRELLDAGLIEKETRDVSEKAKKTYGWERTIILPTPGIMVKGSIDDCPVCEPQLKRQIELDLERKRLENEMLKKQTDLLEKTQEYRCCPKDQEELEE